VLKYQGYKKLYTLLNKTVGEKKNKEEFDDPKEMMIKTLSAIIINHVQSLLNDTSSSVPDPSSSFNPILSESSLTFSNQTDQNDRYNRKQGLSEEIHEIHKGDIAD
jgi:hypothetical protein